MKIQALPAGMILIHGLMGPSKTQQKLQMFVLLVLSRMVNPQGCLMPQGLSWCFPDLGFDVIFLQEFGA
ncbi:hypothetical protein Nmel_013260 [Mimus melanotis]